ncbi:TetR family transcriptional regulator [Amycolatopsis thermoflava]|uniref:TetR family transcriptional regulator n=1 Tax=Amycolatopsis thermoflava TaxID=84480 RepID=UPI0038187833
MTQMDPGEPVRDTGTDSPARGRPPKVTGEELEQVALTLWDERGYDAVPLAEVAAAAGVTPRTIFRYFPSKSEIVWGGLIADISGMRDLLDASPPGESLLTRIRIAVTQLLASAENKPLDRLRLRIISRTPELQHSMPEPFRVFHTIVRDWLAAELDGKPDDLAPQVIASGVQAAILRALLWWSTQGSAEPHDAVDEALRHLENAVTPH